MIITLFFSPKGNEFAPSHTQKRQTNQQNTFGCKDHVAASLCIRKGLQVLAKLKKEKKFCVLSLFSEFFHFPTHHLQNYTISVLDQMYLLLSSCLLNDFKCIYYHCLMQDIFVSLEESNNSGQIQTDESQGLGTLQDSTFLSIVHGSKLDRLEELNITTFQLVSLKIF